jgi:4-hydroxy-tetrahydrodipicolinate reductase
MNLKICIAGATGWTGSAVARAVMAAPDLTLAAAVARATKGQDVGRTLGLDAAGVTIAGTVAEALAGTCDVLIDYTHPTAVKDNVLQALSRGVSVVVGTSGLSAQDFVDIDATAREADLGVIAAGNFSLTAALVKHFAGIAARHVPHWEIIDYAHGGKPDAPSGTVRELADFLGEVSRNEYERPVDETLGEPATRGATLGGAQVHSVRLPGYVIAFEAIFGMHDERLSLRHDAGSGAEPYVNGTLLAARRAPTTRGLVRGLDTLLFPAGPTVGGA